MDIMVNMESAWLSDDVFAVAANEYCRAYKEAYREARKHDISVPINRKCADAIATEYIKRWFVALPPVKMCMSCGGTVDARKYDLFCGICNNSMLFVRHDVKELMMSVTYHLSQQLPTLDEARQDAAIAESAVNREEADWSTLLYKAQYTLTAYGDDPSNLPADQSMELLHCMGKIFGNATSPGVYGADESNQVALAVLAAVSYGLAEQVFRGMSILSVVGVLSLEHDLSDAEWTALNRVLPLVVPPRKLPSLEEQLASDLEAWDAFLLRIVRHVPETSK